MSKYRIRYSAEHDGYFIERRKWSMFGMWLAVSFKYTEDGARERLKEILQNPDRVVVYG
jgi:hypothetical protein